MLAHTCENPPLLIRLRNWKSLRRTRPEWDELALSSCTPDKIKVASILSDLRMPGEVEVNDFKR
jgi:hypothetical protein